MSIFGRRAALLTIAAAAVLVSAGCVGGGEDKGLPDKFSTLPNVCDLVSREKVAELVDPSALPSGQGFVETTSCTWTHTPSEIPKGADRQPYRRTLGVSVTLYRAKYDRSGSYWAGGTFRLLRDDPGMGPSELVSGIGAEAYEWFGRYGAGEAGIEFHRANLTVTVTYGGNDVGADGKALDMNSDAAKNGAQVAAAEVDRSLQRISDG